MTKNSFVTEGTFKQSRHDFSGKHLCNGCVDIMCLRVEVKTHGLVKLL